MKAQITNISQDTLYIPSFYKSLTPGGVVTTERTQEQVNADTVIRTYLVDGKISLEWLSEPNDGAVSPQILALDDIILYVDPVNGDDSRDGRSRATALKTVARLRALEVPISSGRRINVLMAGTHVWPDGDYRVGQGWNPPPGQAFDPNISELGEVFIGEMTQVAGPFTTSGDVLFDWNFPTVEALTPGALNGAYIEFTDGPFMGWQIRIVNNVAHNVQAVDFPFPFSGPPVTIPGGTHFVVKDMATTIDATVNPSFSGPAGDLGTMVLSTVKWVGGFDENCLQFVLDRVQFRQDGLAVFFRERSRVDTGLFFALPDIGIPQPVGLLDALYCKSVGGLGGSLQIIQRTQFFVGVILENVIVACHDYNQVFLGPYFGTNSPATFDDFDAFLIAGGNVSAGFINGCTPDFLYQFEGGSGPAGACIETFDNAHALFIGGMTFANNTIDLMHCADHSTWDIGFNSGGAGDGNTQFGIHIDVHGTVTSQADTISGTLGDINLDGHTLTYAQVDTAPPLLIPDGSLLHPPATNGRLITGQSGAVANIIVGAPPGAARVSGLTGMSASSVGHYLIISGAASAANNGMFLIVGFTDATTVDIENAAAVVPDANNGAISWSESKAGGAIGDSRGNWIIRRGPELSA